MKTKLLIYGVTGYTGALISKTLSEEGLQHIVAGRNQEKLAKHAKKFSLEARAFSLEDLHTKPERFLSEEIAVVLNCAGPFSYTAEILANACIDLGIHYLDIAGEVPEFEALFSLDTLAIQSGIMLMPGVGFGIVPTDCLAAHLRKLLPRANRLVLAYETIGEASQGTLKTILPNLHKKGVIRKDGKLMPARPAQSRKKIDLGQRSKTVVYNPWRADLFTAFLRTSIPNIETFSVFPSPLPFLMSQSRYMGKVFESNFVQNLWKKMIQKAPLGPNQEQLDQGSTFVWGQVEDQDNNVATSYFQGPEAYLFTALTASMVVKHVLEGNTKAGFQTPSQAFGENFVLEIVGVTPFEDHLFTSKPK